MDIMEVVAGLQDLARNLEDDYEEAGGDWGIVPSEEWCRELRAILAEAEGLRRDPATEDCPDTTESLGLEPRGGF